MAVWFGDSLLGHCVFYFVLDCHENSLRSFAEFASKSRNDEKGVDCFGKSAIRLAMTEMVDYRA